MKLSQEATDKMFIQEIINDLHKRGLSIGNSIKSLQMLKDWSRELTEKAPIMRGRTKKLHAKHVGKELY
jgi:hypothetical protein